MTRRFHGLPGRADALDGCDGKINQLLIVQFISNISAKYSKIGKRLLQLQLKCWGSLFCDSVDAKRDNLT